MGINVIDPGLWVNNYKDLNPIRRDLIEFDRGAYHHWAMFIGKWKNLDEMIVNFKQNGIEEKVSCMGAVDGIVTVAKLKEVAGSSRMRVNNLIDESPRTWADIEYKIEKLENRDGLHYSRTTNNSENFVTYLRFPVTSGFSSEMAFGLLSWFIPTWYYGTQDNGNMQTEQWDEYVKAVEERRKPKITMPVSALTGIPSYVN